MAMWRLSTGALALAAAFAAGGAGAETRWEGFRLGVLAGVSDAKSDGIFDRSEQVAESDFRDTIDGRLFDLTSGAFGAQIGYDRQQGVFVLGVEADWLRLGARSRKQDPDPEFSPATDDATLRLNWAASLRGRIGLVSERTVFFVAPGVAWIDADVRARDRDSGVGSSGKADLSGLGFVIGAGFDHALSPNLSLRFEGRYYVVENDVDASGLTIDADAGDFARLENVAMALLGLTYRFGAAEALEPSDDAVAVDWSGFHLGVTGGRSDAAFDSLFDADERSSDADNDDSVLGELFSLDGGTFGVNAGFALQRGAWVFGVDGDATFLDASDRRYDPDPEFFGTDNATMEINFLASLRGRVGYVSGRSLFYATGGLGYVEATYIAEDPEFGIVDRNKLSISSLGYVVGAGFQHSLTDALSLNVEALYYGFDDRRDTSTLNIDSAPGDFVDLSGVGLVQAGLRYRFGASLFD